MHRFIPIAIVLATTTLAGDLRAEAATAAEVDAQITRSVNRGINFLLNRGQAEDGSFSSETGVAVTALCVRAILENRPEAVELPSVQRSLKFIESKVQSDGGIYTQGSKYRNYETSVSVMALIKANKDDQYDSELRRAEAFLKEIQWDEGEGVESSDTAFGGAGYGSHQRPDLSNTSFFVEALHELGNGADDEAIKRCFSSSSAARIWRARATTPSTPRRSVTEAFITRRPRAVKARRVMMMAAACGATVR